MIEAIITYGIVAVAAIFVLWKIILPQRVRLSVRHKIMGKSAICAPEKLEGSCAGGCPGCGLSQTRPQARSAAAMAREPHIDATPAR